MLPQVDIENAQQCTDNMFSHQTAQKLKTKQKSKTKCPVFKPVKELLLFKPLSSFTRTPTYDLRKLFFAAIPLNCLVIISFVYFCCSV